MREYDELKKELKGIDVIIVQYNHFEEDLFKNEMKLKFGNETILQSKSNH